MHAFLVVLVGLAAIGCHPAVRPVDCAAEPPPDIPGIFLEYQNVLEMENRILDEDGLHPVVHVSTGDEMIKGPLLRVEFCCLTIGQVGNDGNYAVRIPKYMIDNLIIWWDVQ